MLKSLIAVRMRALIHSVQFGGRGKKRLSPIKKLGFAVLALYVIGCFVSLFRLQWSVLCPPLHAAGLDWLYFTLVALTAFVLMVVGSIFTTTAQLYEAKDNEMLLAMPIPPSAILASRMAMLLVMNLFFELLVMAPAVFFYVKLSSITLSGVIAFLVILLTLPLLSTAVSAAVGGLVAAMTARLRKKSLFTMIFSLGFLALYFFGVSNMNTYLQQLILNSGKVADQLSAVSVLYWIGSAQADGNLLHLLLSVVCMVLPFLLVYWLLQKTFLRIATTKHGTAKIRYQEKEEKCRSPIQAVVRKELAGFFASPIYMMNGGLGVIFMLAGAIFLAVKTDQLQLMLAQFGVPADLGAVMVILALCLLQSMCIISAASVSLEGKQIWIPMTMPVESAHILFAKALAQLTIVLPPTLISGGIVAVALGMSLPMAVLAVVLPLLMAVFSALAGVAINLKFPKLEWLSPAQVIKQGASTMLFMLVTGAIGLVPILLLVALDLASAATLFLLGYGVLLLVLCGGLFYWLRTRGSQYWEELLS